MKPLNLLIVVLMFTSIIPYRSFAQEGIKLMVVNKTEFPSGISALKKSDMIKVVYTDRIEKIESVQADSVNKKLIKTFTRSFEKAGNAVWYTCDNKHRSFFVTFEIGERSYTALYMKDGYLVYAISHGSEKDLSVKEKNAILMEYDGYKIIKVTEIITEVETSWSICLQKGKEVVFVKLVERALEELARTTVENDEPISKN